MMKTDWVIRLFSIAILVSCKSDVSNCDESHWINHKEYGKAFHDFESNDTVRYKRTRYLKSDTVTMILDTVVRDQETYTVEQSIANEACGSGDLKYERLKFGYKALNEDFNYSAEFMGDKHEGTSFFLSCEPQRTIFHVTIGSLFTPNYRSYHLSTKTYSKAWALNHYATGRTAKYNHIGDYSPRRLSFSAEAGYSIMDGIVYMAFYTGTDSTLTLELIPR